MICVDSDCVIDLLKNRKEAIAIVDKYKDSLVTTEISVFETFFGIYNKRDFPKDDENSTREFFNSIEVLSMSRGCGKIAAKIMAELYKKGEPIGQNDCFIVSIMKKNGIGSIITKNRKHFSRIKGIEVISY